VLEGRQGTLLRQVREQVGHDERVLGITS
jgi:hypothetical protein